MINVRASGFVHTHKKFLFVLSLGNAALRKDRGFQFWTNLKFKDGPRGLSPWNEPFGVQVSKWKIFNSVKCILKRFA